MYTRVAQGGGLWLEIGKYIAPKQSPKSKTVKKCVYYNLISYNFAVRKKAVKASPGSGISRLPAGTKLQVLAPGRD